MSYVNPSMIEVSYDGVSWGDASALVSNITIVEGQVTAVHVSHARRGTLLEWEGQLGSPDETWKAVWSFDTGLIPTSENRFYLRWKFVVENPYGRTDESPWADISDVVKLIGKPGKAVNTGTGEA